MAENDGWDELDAANEMAADSFEEDGGDEELLKAVHSKRKKKNKELKLNQKVIVSQEDTEKVEDVTEEPSNQNGNPSEQGIQEPAPQEVPQEEDVQPNEPPPEIPAADPVANNMVNPVDQLIEELENIAEPEAVLVEQKDKPDVIPKLVRKMTSKIHIISPNDELGIPFTDRKSSEVDEKEKFGSKEDTEEDKEKNELENLEPLPVSSNLRDLTKNLPNERELQALRSAFDRLSSEEEKQYIEQWRKAFPVFREWRKIEQDEEDAISIDSMFMAPPNEAQEADSYIIADYSKGEVDHIQKRKKKELGGQYSDEMKSERTFSKTTTVEEDRKLDLELKASDEAIEARVTVDHKITDNQRQSIAILNEDELDLLFSKFSFQGLPILSKVCPEWRDLISKRFAKQTHLWFLNDENNSRRLLPIDDCCRQCDSLIGSEPVVRIQENLLHRVIFEILVSTHNLKCLRLYRFVLKHIKLVNGLTNQCPRLIHLDLTECHGLNFIMIEALVQRYPRMLHLILKSTNLDEDMMACVLKGMTILESLVVASTLITGASLTRMPKSLKRLDVRRCTKLSDHLLATAFRVSCNRGLTHIKLDAHNSQPLFDDLIERYKSSLVVLELSEVNQRLQVVIPVVGHIGPKFHFDDLQELQSLTIAPNVEFDSPSLKKLMENLKKLRSFSMECGRARNNEPREGLFEFRFRQFDTEALSQMATEWSILERLELRNCTQVDRSFMTALIQMKNLRYLDLTFCIKLTDDALVPVLLALNKLTYLVVDMCHNLSKGTLDAIIKKAHRMPNQTLTASMLRCDLRNLPRLKSKLLPKNLRLSTNSMNSKLYWTFDGKRIRSGNMHTILDFVYCK